MEHSYKYQVLISCLTYNHSTYINDALDGFCMQKTNFPYVCTIFDDASTDGEQDVLTDYIYQHFDMEDRSVARREETVDYVFFFARNKNNTNCYFAIFLLKYNHYSIKKPKSPYSKEWNEAKYIALCEGDDYWIDPLKLQKQVDFLEMHPEYSMCFHRAKILKMDSSKCFLECKDIENRDYNPNELFLHWKVPTASMVFKREACDICNIGKERVLNVDIVLVLNCASIGKVYGMSDEMSVYRVHQGGVTYNYKVKRNRRLRYPDHYRFIKENYPFIKRSIVNKKILRAVLLKAIFKMPLPFEFIYRLTGR